MNQTFRVAVAALLCVGVAACAKKTTVKQPETTPERQASTERATSGKYTRDSLDTDACLRQRVVYFDFDKARSSRNSRWPAMPSTLRQFPDARVSLEGNADRRTRSTTSVSASAAATPCRAR